MLAPTLDGTGVMDLASNGVAITICKNGSYCCGDGTFGDKCCTQNQGVFLSNGSITQQNSVQNPLTSSISTSIVSLTLLTSMTTTAPTAFHSNFPSETLSSIPTANKAALATRTIVGGAVGGVACVALLLLGIWMWKRRDFQIPQNRRNTMLQWQDISNSDLQPRPRQDANVQSTAELCGEHDIREIDGTNVIFELDASKTLHELD